LVKLETGKETGVIMHGQCLVAVYPSRSEAEQAFRAARGSGIPSHNIRMSGADADIERSQSWEWLFSGHVPERDKTYYRAHLAEGRTALSVLLDGSAPPARIDALEEILDRYHPVDVRVEEEESADAAAGRAEKAGSASVRAAAASKKAAKKGGGQSAQAAAQAAPKGQDEIIPLPREEAKVSTRATDRVRHIRTYVVEEPFEKEVSLSDEHLVVERRATTMSDGGELSARDYEFHERHEEPVVEMETRTDEELVVRKEPTKHTERVRGTARRTEAEVEKDDADAERRTEADVEEKDVEKKKGH
jgi:hypothetical protein